MACNFGVCVLPIRCPVFGADYNAPKGGLLGIIILCFTYNARKYVYLAYDRLGIHVGVLLWGGQIGRGLDRSAPTFGVSKDKDFGHISGVPVAPHDTRHTCAHQIALD